MTSFRLTPNKSGVALRLPPQSKSVPAIGKVHGQWTFSAVPLAIIKSFVVKSFTMPATTSPSQSAEDYLERIHELIEEKGYARVVDIASTLKVKQASVTSMVQKLGEAG